MTAYTNRSGSTGQDKLTRKMLFYWQGCTMNMPIEAVEVPLFDDGQGGLRVTGTRILLERIVHAFEDGATAEGIVQSYDTLHLPDVYAVLTWYLRHKAEVADY